MTEFDAGLKNMISSLNTMKKKNAFLKFIHETI